MIRLFISQPMRDLTHDEIERIRKEARKDAELLLNEPVEVVPSFFENLPHEHEPVYCLAKSIEQLSGADAIWCCPGWRTARGCRFEHDIAVAYGIKVLNA